MMGMSSATRIRRTMTDMVESTPVATALQAAGVPPGDLVREGARQIRTVRARKGARVNTRS